MSPPSRRDFLKLGVTVGAGLAAFPAAQALADVFLDQHLDSPPVPSFSVPLRIPPVLRPVRRSATTDFYEITQRVASVPILPGRPPTSLWTYNGLAPGPSIIQTQGRDVRVRQHNRLPVPVSVHLHGGDVPPDSDGHPLDLIPPGSTKHYHYPGLHQPAPLWYHDHAIHDTARNVYMGLAGTYTVTNALEQALPLPRGRFHIPLVIQDKFFRINGQIAYPMHDSERPMRQGVFGDVILVNGRPKPFLRVERRRYRFRLQDSSNARVYRLRLSPTLPFTVIQTDGGFIERPLETQEIELSPSERISVVIDFSKVRVGTSVFLRNVMENVPGDPFDEEKTRDVMRFDVTEDAVDRTRIPVDLPEVANLPRPQDAVRTRTWEFARNSGEWTINDKPWNANRFDAFPKLGSTEIWRFVNKGGGWWHPIHVHLIEFLPLKRDRRPVRAYERGPKDTILLRDNETATVAIKWLSFRGDYVMHCHNTEHEDHDMMNQFRVV